MLSKGKKTNILYGMGSGEQDFQDKLQKSSISIREGNGKLENFEKSITNFLDGNGSAPNMVRLAFEVDPTRVNATNSYIPKMCLTPNSILQRIAIQDPLVANIVRIRQEQVSPFGRPRATRFDIGFSIEPRPGVTSEMGDKEKAELEDRRERGIKLLATCGHTENVAEGDLKSFSEYLSLSVRSAVTVGYMATEIMKARDEAGNPKFHRFIATDSASIYRASPDEGAQKTLKAIRKTAIGTMERIAGQKLVPEDASELHDKEITWVQVMGDSRPVQAFTDDDIKVYNFYPVLDLDMRGYPVTPIDTILNSITTHLNIGTHNRLYFESGRATRGMLLIKSDDATPQTVHNIKQHFNNSINNVRNSWRMPTLSCGVDESIEWTPIDTGTNRDMEFQYLTDMNCREILCAFGISPDELPAYSYLSRGTNSQSLSESNNEYKLEAARDVGIRPILSKLEDFVNAHLLPLIDPYLAEHCVVRFVGLDQDNAEKEAVRTDQDQKIWMTYDDVMERVEKEPVGKENGGNIPMNPAYQAIMYRHLTVGQVEEVFMGLEGNAQKPDRSWYADPMWLQWKSMEVQVKSAAQPQPGQPPPGGAPPGQDPNGGQDPNQQDPNQSHDPDMANAANQAQQMMKAIPQEKLTPNLRRMLDQHQKTLDFFTNGFEEDLKDAEKEILGIADSFKPKVE